MEKNDIMSTLNCSVDNNLNIASSPNFTQSDGSSPFYSCWDYWQRDYYPYVIHDSYPVYIQERAKDRGKQAFEIIKVLMDKKLLKLYTVRDFIEAMDTLIKIL